VAPAPAGVSAAAAAGLPLNGLTAWQALHRLAVPPTGWLLVTGAAGAVGGLAVQLAKLQGLRVVAHARADDRDLVRRLGADLFVSTDEPIGPAVRALVPGGVDAALDAANLAIAAMDAVRHGGSYVSLLNRAPQARRDIESINLAYRTDRAQLGVLSALASAGAISTVVAREFPLDEARAAHEYRLAGGFRGLVVITA
jgi:NADPH2:quinone reductase